jgi:hypothetical protein
MARAADSSARDEWPEYEPSRVAAAGPSPIDPLEGADETVMTAVVMDEWSHEAATFDRWHA